MPIRLIVRILYWLFVASLASFTFVEWLWGKALYSSLPFLILFGLLTIGGLIFLFKHSKKPGVILIHLSLAIIVLGALVSFVFSQKGILHLREGIEQNTFITNDGVFKKLPKQITLQEFLVVTYPGTDTPMDFVSKVVVGQTDSSTISMNKVLNVDGYRFFQSSFDADHKGSIFMVNYDPWGMRITYFGYFLLFIFLIWMLFNPKGNFRKIIQRLSILILIFLPNFAFANNNLRVPSKEQAQEFAKICVLYNNRIVPLNTYASDFCLKLTGKNYWKNYSSEQVLLGWLLYPEDWQHEKMLKLKNAPNDSSIIKLENKYCSVASLFDSNGELKFAYSGMDKPSKFIVEVNDKLQLIIGLTDGSALKIFPIEENGKFSWKSSVDNLPDSLDNNLKIFFTSWMQMTKDAIDSNDNQLISLIPLQIARYQLKVLKDDLPSPTIRKIEIVYNKISPTKWLFMAIITFGFLLLFLSVLQLIKGGKNWINVFLLVCIILFGLLQIISIAIRGIISGYFPISNGYETMLFLALSIMVVGFFVRKIQTLLGSLCVLLSGFALLVAHIGISNPNITPLMPVLHSPWLSIHVMSVMISYSLFTVVMINSLLALILCKNNSEKLAKFSDVSLFLLYPAITLLGIGIFIGAIWANESWGNYWSWDPKEVWALITLLVYVVPMHPSLFTNLCSGKKLHIYLIFAFLTVLMTYFGVNYLLGGMHSYAG